MSMTKDAFIEWRESRGINAAEAAHVLCVTRTQVWRWEHEKAPIPEVTALLCWILRNNQVFEAVKTHRRFVPHRRGRKKRSE